MLQTASFSGHLEAVLETYMVLIDDSENKEDFMSYQKRTEGNHVVANVFPLTKNDKEGMAGDQNGETSFQSGTEIKDVEAFQYDKCQDKKDGVLCILGAGSYNGLTSVDVVHGLFVRNRCVFVKLHPLRGFLDNFLRTIFSKLFTDGFMDSEPDKGIEHTKAIVYSDFVTSVHMTP
jgi:hypothetical protein